MLDNESTTDTTGSGPEPDASAALAPAKKTARKRATKKAATPAVAPAAEPEGSAPTQEQPPADVPVKRPARKRAAKKVAPDQVPLQFADPSEAAVHDQTGSPQSGSDQTGSAAPSSDGTAVAAEKQTTKRAPRKRTAKKLPQHEHPESAEAHQAEPAQEQAPQRQQAPEPAADATEQTQETAAAQGGGTAMVFQPPVQAPPRRRRAASRPAGPPQGPADTAPPAAPAEDELADESGESIADNGPGAALPAAGDLAVDDANSEQDPDQDEDDESGARRRRRRGGRGRRRRSGNESEGNESSEPSGAGGEATGAAGSTVEGQPADSTPTAEAADGTDPVDESTGDEGKDGSGSRRRRRRRRGGGGGDAENSTGSDDPPNTVVRVRQPRQSRESKDSKESKESRESRDARDEVTGVKGSTRLEAKRQRRRDGRDSGRRRQIITESEFLARREAVERTMIVREHDGKTQIVGLEDGVLVEHYVARKASASLIGNVYLGRVQNVLPSMEAAFVDIGKGRNAVLYAGEVNWDAAGLEGQPRRIELALRSGDPVLVQVSKDPVGHKGARLTSQISLPGRYLVYVPNSSMTGISRKLPDTERARLKKILKAVVPDHAGVIVRTAAEGASEAELERDVARLQTMWETIEKQSKAANPPHLLHGEPDLTIKVVRDVFNEDFAGLIVAGDEAWTTVKEYVEQVAPDLSDRVTRWEGEKDVFAEHRVDEQIAKGLERKVWLPSGGSLVIDRTEAMTVVDVNTGKFVGSGGNLEETVTRNNLEAAEEIVRQLRLRDVGGIIVIDFIDMVLEVNRDLVLRRLMECLGRDRTKHQVAEVTSLGLVQMTRKRVGQGLLEAFSEPCAHCQGSGVVLFDEPVESKGGTAAPEPTKGSQPPQVEVRRGHSEAQKVAEASRKAKEKAMAREAAVPDAGAGVERLASLPEPAPVPEPATVPELAPVPELRPEAAPLPEPDLPPVAESPQEPVAEPVQQQQEADLEPVTAAEQAAPAKKRRRRATSPSTTPGTSPAAALQPVALSASDPGPGTDQ